jgi:hypothetical protein
MEAVIAKIDTQSGFVEKLYKNDSAWFISLRRMIFFMMLIKSYLFGFSVLLVIDHYGRYTDEDDEDHECIVYGQPTNKLQTRSNSCSRTEGLTV